MGDSANKRNGKEKERNERGRKGMSVEGKGRNKCGRSQLSCALDLYAFLLIYNICLTLDGQVSGYQN